MPIIFDKKNIIKENLYGNNRAYYIKFDIDGNYQIDSTISTLLNVIPEFAFGFHHGASTHNTELIEKLKIAAKSIYQIKEFLDILSLISRGNYSDEIDDKYLKRGEFGELILHLLLRDRFDTIPLLSKIYFKDSYGHTVHGFDSIHITPDTQTLWLGESKLYKDPKQGITELLKDLDEHFTCDFLENEFSIIAKRIHDSQCEEYNKAIQDRAYWIKLLQSTDWKENLKSINIPLICTYSSNNIFSQYTDNDDLNFITAYKNEITSLIEYFNERNAHKWKDKLNIILILFPVKDKNELVRLLHSKLHVLQQI